MISWISQLCALCAMSALMQLLLPTGSGRDGIRLLCGLMMLHLTCRNAQELMERIADSADLAQILSCLIS